MVATLERLEKADRRKRDADLVIGVLAKHMAEAEFLQDDEVAKIAADMHDALEEARRGILA